MTWKITGAPGTGDDLLYSQAGTPTLDLRFASSKSLSDNVSGQNLITFTRSGNATYFDADGVIQTAGTNTARFDHDPATGESLGLLIEEQRQNLLLNSATLATQDVTVTAVAHTLSFYGTGTVTLSGTHSATVVGTGAYPTRTTLTFTPTAGTLTVTVSGTVQYANLEAGSFATSWIPTLGTTVTRNADVAQITGSNFSRWYSQSQGTVFASMSSASGAAYTGYLLSIGPDFNNAIQMYRQSDTQPVARIRVGGVDTYGAVGNGPVWTGKAVGRFALAVSPSSGRQAFNGLLDIVGDDTSVALPAASSMALGSLIGASNFANAHIRRLAYFDRRLPNATLQDITAS
jgi:hypothetical protein